MIGGRIAGRLADLARTLAAPRCEPCGRSMHVVNEVPLPGSETAFEVLYACARCGAYTRRLKTYEPVH